jgi:transcriptional regulator with XRE-family HTH domain
MTGDPELGRQLRQQRKSAGLTLAHVAELASCSVSQLSNVEAGRRRAFPEVISAYARATKAADMRRRSLITGSAALVAPQAASQILREGFSARLSPRPADDWEAQLDTLGRSYMQDGAPVVREALTSDLAVLQHSPESPRMWSVAARTMAIYGKTTEGPADAIEWYRLASLAAERSEDTDTRVWVAGRAALALGYEGAATPIALQFASAAVELASERPSHGLLNALMGQAHALATRGRADAAREAWDSAQRVYDRLSPGDEVTDFNYPWWRFSVVASLLHARLGDPAAEHWQAEVTRYRPDNMLRFVTHLELHKGLMIARAGDYRGGVAAGESALAALPIDKRSQSLYLMLDEIKKTKHGR